MSDVGDPRTGSRPAGGADWKARALRAEMVVAQLRGLRNDLATPGTSFGAKRRIDAILLDYDLSD